VPRLPSFAVVETPKGWRVRVPASLSDTGRDQARFFRTKAKAIEFSQEQRAGFRSHGERHCVLPPRVADDALAAWRLLESYGISLLAAAKIAVARQTRIDDSVTVAAAVKKWQADCEIRLRQTTRDSYDLTTKRLTDAHAEAVLAALTGAQLAACISGKSYAMHRRNLGAFWKWCATPPRRWCDLETLADVPRVSTQNDHDITVLRPAEVLAILRAAEANYPETVPIYAIGFFAGVRVEERGKIDHAHLTEDGIEITSAIAKKRRRRFIPISETLTAWLARYPFAPCPNWTAKDCAVRRLAGWDVSARILKTPPEETTRGKWPRNVIRHTHASAEIANGALLEDLLFRFGHTDKAETLRSHYVGRYTKRDAEEFFSIKPLE